MSPCVLGLCGEYQSSSRVSETGACDRPSVLTKILILNGNALNGKELGQVLHNTV